MINRIKTLPLDKLLFIAINILSSLLIILRTVLFLKTLTNKDLGFIMVFQAAVAILGLAQFGFFNGGLRIFSENKRSAEFKEVNNTNFTYVVLITIIFIVLSLIFPLFKNENPIIITISIFFGGTTMLKAWFSNILVARRELKIINKFNLITSISSVFIALSVFKIGVIGAFFSIGSMSLIFIILFYTTQPKYRSSFIIIKYNMIRKLLLYGFIPYLTGVAVLLNNQIDKFYVAHYLSLKDLGQFYIAYAFLNIFNMLPNNLNSLFVPVGINVYSQGEFKHFRKKTTQYLLIIILYCLLTYVLLSLFGYSTINRLFPEKINQLKYLYILLPGFFALTISYPFSYFLYVGLNYRGILRTNIFSLVAYIILLYLLFYYNKVSIENVAYVKSVQGVLVLLFLILVTFSSYNKIKNFYFINRLKI